MSARSGLRADLAGAQQMLDGLEMGAVVLDKYGHAWQCDRVYWYRAFGDTTVFSSWDLAQMAPLKTVWDAKE